ncbi:hypothetical protein AB4243_17630, partial [Enterovibrio norvegicus]
MKNIFAKMLLMSSVALSGCGGGDDEAGGSPPDVQPSGADTYEVHRVGEGASSNLTVIPFENEAETKARGSFVSTSFMGTSNDALSVPAPSSTNSFVEAEWGWGTALVTTDNSAEAAINLAGFNSGYLNFEAKGSKASLPFAIGFKTGLPTTTEGNEQGQRADKEAGVDFESNGRSITTEWVSYKIPMSELIGDQIIDLSDVTMPLFVRSEGINGEVIELRNVFYGKTFDSQPDTSDTGGGNNIIGGEPQVGYILYTGQEANVAFEELQAWNGAGISEVSGGTYDPVLELTVTGGWGALAWASSSSVVDFTPYTHAQFKVKTDASQVRVSITGQSDGEVADDYALSTGTALADDWVQMEIPVPAFADVTTFAVVLGQDGTMEVADIALVNNSRGNVGPGYIAYSDQDDSFSMAFWGDNWGSGATLADLNDAPYSKAFTVTSGANWGADAAAVAWGNEPENAVDASAFSYLRFKVEPGSYSAVDVVFQSASQSEVKNTYNFSSGETLDNGWVQMEVPFPAFSDMTWIGLIFNGAGSVNFADVVLVSQSGSDGNTDGGTD